MNHLFNPESLVALRDWFAGQALAGHFGFVVCTPTEAAEAAYRYADAMLTERQRNEPNHE